MSAFEGEKAVAKIGLGVIAAPFNCFKEAWMPGSTNGAATNPLEGGLNAMRDMTDQGMQDQLDAALRKAIV